MRWKRWKLKIRILGCGKPSWQVAQELGIRPELLSKITSGAANPKPELKKQLAGYFACSENELFDDAANDGVGAPGAEA